MKYLDLALTSALLLVGCNGQPNQCTVPANGASQVLNAVRVPLPDFPTENPLVARDFPDSCVEFDYTPVAKEASTVIGGDGTKKCRMLWCGGYHGGVATLWCR